jgi:hypothetical protein
MTWANYLLTFFTGFSVGYFLFYFFEYAALPKNFKVRKEIYKGTYKKQVIISSNLDTTGDVFFKSIVRDVPFRKELESDGILMKKGEYVCDLEIRLWAQEYQQGEKL